MPRGVVDGVRAFHRDTPRLLVHVFAVAELRLDDVDLFHVLESRGPLTGLETYDAADDLGQPLQHDEDAGHGNHRLERIDRRALGGDRDRKSTRLNSSHLVISYAVFCLKKKKTINYLTSITKTKTTKKENKD